jgi:hypothetical protein
MRDFELHPKPATEVYQRELRDGLQRTKAFRLEEVQGWAKREIGSYGIRSEHDYIYGLKQRLAEYDRAIDAERALVR